MSKHIFYDIFLDHYDALYLMIRSAAILGSQNSEAYDRDARQLIDFIGQVYGWPQEWISSAEAWVLGDLMRVGLIADYHALSSADILDETVRDNRVFFEMKGKAIEEVLRIELAAANGSGQKTVQEIRNIMNAGLFHHAYDPRVKFSQMKGRAADGDVVCSLQMAMMLIIGIGCESDVSQAQRLLERLLIWGEKAAAKILASLWTWEEDGEQAAFYQRIFEWLDSPGLSPPPFEYCTVISAIRSFIVCGMGRREMDLMLADLMVREEIPFAEKLAMICRYKDGAWMHHYNQAQEKTKIGFLR